MNFTNRRWYADYRPYERDAVALHLLREDGDKRHYITFEATTHELDVNETRIWGPTLRLPGDEAQQIMDQLWQVGIRPRDGSGALAHVEGMQAHLDDLRKIAFHALKFPVPPQD